MARPTEAQVRTLATDASSLTAGLKLATAGPWSDVGHDDRAVWGRCRGSGKTPYQVAVDTHGPAYRCSCPSRKFPRKHALGLLLLWTRQPDEVPAGTAPGDVAAWLGGRSAKGRGGSIAGAAAGRTAPEELAPAEAAAPRQADPEAAARRAAERVERMVAGMEDLDRWLVDLLRSGLGEVPSRPWADFDSMAARLVDAQAPAAATAVRRLPSIAHGGEGWPSRLLAAVARLHLLAAGWARWADLDDDTRADLRTAAGWPWPTETVLGGTRVRDQWYVLARSETEEERVTALRTWLWGTTTGALGLVLDFARPGAVPAWELWPGNVIDADVVRYPGHQPLRIVIAERYGEPATGGPPPAWSDLAELADARGRALAASPWVERWPVSVRDVTPVPDGGGWAAVDRDGRRAPLRTADPRTGDAGLWRLLAASSGRGIHLLGEWWGGRLSPLGVWSDDAMVVL